VNPVPMYQGHIVLYLFVCLFVCLSVCLSKTLTKNFNLLYKSLILYFLRARLKIFGINVPWDKTFQLTSKFWPRSKGPDQRSPGLWGCRNKSLHPWILHFLKPRKYFFGMYLGPFLKHNCTKQFRLEPRNSLYEFYFSSLFAYATVFFTTWEATFRLQRYPILCMRLSNCHVFLCPCLEERGILFFVSFCLWICLSVILQKL